MSARDFRLPATRRSIRRDLDDELALHMALRAEQLERSGMSPEQARREAERLFGDPDAVRSDCLAIDEAHRVRRARWNAWEELRQDVAFAMRTLRRDLSFALVSVCIVALGIGATTAIRAVFDTVVRRPLDVPDVDRLSWVTAFSADGNAGVSPAAFLEWRERARSVEQLTSLRPTSATLLGSGEPMRVEGLRVSDGFFELLRIRPVVGRFLRRDDFSPNATPAIVLTHALWRERFGGDSAVVGRSIQLDGVVRNVVGVLPPTLEVLGGGAQFVVPDVLAESLRDNWTPFLSTIGRLRSGATLESASRELQGLAESRWRTSRSEPFPLRASAIPLLEHITRDFRDRVQLILAGVMALLLIGCVNVGNLFLARAATRGREMALRASLGASRGRLVRQLLTEHGVLALVGAGAGVLLSIWMIRALSLVLPAELPRLSAAALDAWGVGFAAALGVVTLLVAGLAPAVRAARVDVRSALQSGGRGSTASVGSDRLRRVFVVAQLAVTTALLVVAGLLLRSERALSKVSPGFGLDDVLAARYALPAVEYDSPTKVLDAHERIRHEVAAILAGSDVALSSAIPLGDGGGGSDFQLVGGSGGSAREINAGLRFVSPGYIATMGITLLGGREIEASDVRDAPRVVVVSEGLARALGLGVNLVGRSIVGTASPFRDSAGVPIPLQVVGIVREPRDDGLRNASRAQVFFPLAQTPDEVFEWSARAVHVVTRGAPRATMARAIVAGVQRVDAKLPVEDVRTMGERLRAAVALERANTSLIVSMGAAALLLAVTGLFGVVSFAVAQRRPEIGVRLALGAVPRDIVTMIVRWGARLAMIGLVAGLPLALAVSRIVRGLLFGIAPFDVVTFAGVAVLLAAVAIASALLPARRASRVAPASILQG